MNRRNFFKALGVSAVALSVAPSLALDSVSEEIYLDETLSLLFTKSLEDASVRLDEQIDMFLLCGVNSDGLLSIKDVSSEFYIRA